MTEIIRHYDFADRTVAEAVQRAGRRTGTFLVAPGGTLRFEELPQMVARAAGLLQAAGASRAAPVAIYMTSRVEFPALWWGAAWAGLTAGLVHADQRGPTLTHTLTLLAPEVLVVEDVLLDRVEEIAAALPTLRTVLVVGDAPADFAVLPRLRTLRLMLWKQLIARAAELDPVRLDPAEVVTIMMTSGTTGPSKGVLRSQHFDFMYGALAAEGIGIDESSLVWSASPVSHARTASCILHGALLAGAGVRLAPRFSASRFWSELSEAGATHTYMSNWMANVLMKQPPRPTDRQHAVKVVHCLPPPNDLEQFRERFGVKLTGQGYGSTEAYPMPQQLATQDWSRPRNFLGKPHPLMQVAAMGEDGRQVPADGVSYGQLLVKPVLPHAMLTGYHRNPEATAEAIHDGWFHTGDRVAVDGEGNLYFGGRLTDSIRRRGENVSAWEIEQSALAIAGVAEASAFGVPSDMGEEDIKLDVVLERDSSIDEPALLERLRAALPRYMLPRYIQIRPELPKNPNGRVEKYVLRAAPVDPQIFDVDRSRVGEQPKP